MAGIDRTHHDAGRLAILGRQIVVIDPVDAQGAFLHDAFVVVELAGAVGTGPRAELATDADRFVDQHDAVLDPLIGGASGAHGDAGRLQAHLDLVRAEVAFGRGLGGGVDVERVIRAALHAGLAADAAPRVEVHDPVAAAEERGRRADLDAGRVVAVVAAGDLERAARLREDAVEPLADVGADAGHRMAHEVHEPRAGEQAREAPDRPCVPRDNQD